MISYGKYKLYGFLIVFFIILQVISFLYRRDVDVSFMGHSKYSSCEIVYYKESPRKLQYYNMKAQYLDNKGQFKEVGVDLELRNYRDTINYISKTIFLLEDTLSERAEVLLCPPDAKEYQVPYDSFVKYCGDTLFWKEKCEEDWYYYK